MATLEQIADGLATAAETAASMTAGSTVKGLPRWNPTTLTSPKLSLRVMGAGTVTRRMGEAPVIGWRFRLVAFALHEVQLWTMVQALTAWIAATPLLSISGSTYKATLAAIERWANDTENPVEEYGMVYDIEVTGL